MDFEIQRVTGLPKPKKLEPPSHLDLQRIAKDSILKMEATGVTNTLILDQAPQLLPPSGQSLIELFKRLETPETMPGFERLIKALSLLGTFSFAEKSQVFDLSKLNQEFVKLFLDLSQKMQDVFPESLKQFVRSFAFQLEAFPSQESNPAFVTGLIRQLDAFEKETISLFVFWKTLSAEKTTTLSKEEVAFLQANPFIAHQFKGATELNFKHVNAILQKFFQGVEVIFSLKGVLEVFKALQESPKAPFLILAGQFTHPYPKTTLVMGQQIETFLEKMAESVPNSESKDVGKVMEQGLLFGALYAKAIAKTATSPKQQAELFQELKIVDQIPFSLFAHFVPFKREGEGSREYLKAAKSAVNELMRLLFQLCFLLGAIFAGGEKKIKALLIEHQLYLLSLLENLTFSFKKVSDFYGVRMEEPLKELEQAKSSLREGDIQPFFTHLFLVFDSHLPLAEFLEEFEDADPFFKAIDSLIDQAEVILPPFRM